MVIVFTVFTEGSGNVSYSTVVLYIEIMNVEDFLPLNVTQESA